MRFIKNYLVTGLLFGLAMSVFFTWRYGLALGITGGIICAALFGFAIAFFLEWMHWYRKKLQPYVLENEKLLWNDNANHIVGIQADGGWLYLSDKRLVFVPHPFNGVPRPDISILLQDIVSVQPCRSFGIIPNGLRITTSQNHETFVVHRRKQWVQRVQAAVQNCEH